MSLRIVFGAACLLMAGACTTELEDNSRVPDSRGIGLQNGKLVEDQSVYANNGISVVRVDVTLTPDSPFTLDEINSDTDPRDDFMPEARVRLAIADLEDDASNLSNASLRLRGDTTRFASQKSYRIRLDTEAGLWRGQDRLQLNKHAFDLTRIRNKLSFDLFAELENLTSLRTQFVQLFIDGEDHGLYTHIEHVAEPFLLNHGLDTRAPVYKAQNFVFDANDPAMRLTSDPAFDKAAFEAVLEAKGSNDHGPLLEMIGAVTNTADADFQPVFDRYFNEDNFLSWLATAILFGNVDTLERNFYLYSPRATDQWFFLPWDYDDAWGLQDQPATTPLTRRRWQEGLANWSLGPMYRKWLKQPGNIDKLTARVEQVRAQVTPARISALVDAYLSVMASIPLSLPDADFLPAFSSELTPEQEADYRAEAARLSTTVENEYQVYLATLDRPFTIFQALPERLEGGGLFYFWDESFARGGAPIRYDIAVATTPTFDEGTVVLSREGLSETSFVDPQGLPPGDYFFRVLIRNLNDPDNFQISAENFRGEGAPSRGLSGVLSFTVE